MPAVVHHARTPPNGPGVWVGPRRLYCLLRRPPRPPPHLRTALFLPSDSLRVTAARSAGPSPLSGGVRFVKLIVYDRFNGLKPARSEHARGGGRVWG